MIESKSLKAIVTGNSQAIESAEQCTKQQKEVNMKINQWMQSQHNCTIRNIAPYYNQLALLKVENEEVAAREMHSTLIRIFSALHDDDQVFQNLRDTVNNAQNTLSNCMPITNEVDDKNLEAMISNLNANFVAKEVKKIIRFKFGLSSALDCEERYLRNRLALVESQRQILALIPEVYEKETFKKSRVGIENRARQILKTSPSTISSCKASNSNHNSSPSHPLLDVENYNNNSTDIVKKCSTFIDQSEELDSNDSIVADSIGSVHKSNSSTPNQIKKPIDSRYTQVDRQFLNTKLKNLTLDRNNHGSEDLDSFQLDDSDAESEKDSQQFDFESQKLDQDFSDNHHNLPFNYTLDASDLYVIQSANKEPSNRFSSKFATNSDH